MGVSREFIKLTKFIKFTFITALLCPAFAYAQTQDIPAKIHGKKFYKHIVEKGETIYGIARQFNEQPKDIVLENPAAIEGVHPGDTLLIPIFDKLAIDTAKATTTDVRQDNYIYHTVIGKETLYSLAKEYGTTVSILDTLNPQLAVKGLQVGQRIRVPAIGGTGATTASKDKHALTKDSIPPSTPHQQANTNKQEAQAYKNLLGGGKASADTSKSLVSYKDTGKKLGRYNIALIMPFATEGIDTLRLGHLLDGTAQVPTITQISYDFYHGLLLAFDSLAKKGFKANLQLFNVSAVSDTSSHAIDSILKNPGMVKMNLIIGPPYPSSFMRVARFAGLHHIAIVSPLSVESNVLKNNPWTSKITPSPLTEIEKEAEYIAAHYNHANIILIHNKDANDEYYNVFKKQFRKADSALGYNDTLRHAESIGGVTALGSKIIRSLVNIVVMPYQGASFVAKFVNELANSKYSYDDSLVVFGMHNWANNDALAPDNLDTLNFHFPSNEFVNYKDLTTQKFIVKYRNDFLSEPSYFSYEGYDAAMFYGTLLYTYGTDIQNHLGDSKYKGVQTSFDMFRSSPSTGFENKTVYILEYKSYTERLDSR